MVEAINTYRESILDMRLARRAIRQAMWRELYPDKETPKVGTYIQFVSDKWMHEFIYLSIDVWAIRSSPCKCPVDASTGWSIVYRSSMTLVMHEIIDMDMVI